MLLVDRCGAEMEAPVRFLNRGPTTESYATVCRCVSRQHNLPVDVVETQWVLKHSGYSQRTALSLWDVFVTSCLWLRQLHDANDPSHVELAKSRCFSQQIGLISQEFSMICAKKAKTTCRFAFHYLAFRISDF